MKASRSNVLPLPRCATKMASARLRRARLAAGISQEEAARRIGVSSRSYGAWERGDVGLQALEALIVLEASASSGPYQGGARDTGSTPAGSTTQPDTQSAARPNGSVSESAIAEGATASAQPLKRRAA